MGEKGQKYKKYSPEFKEAIILDMRGNHLGYREAARKYGLVEKSMGGAISTIHRWERIYQQEGAEGLMKERRGKANAAGGLRKSRAAKLEKGTEEDLIAENQRLRMEIEYLKKLSALVLAEERKKGKKL